MDEHDVRPRIVRSTVGLITLYLNNIRPLSTDDCVQIKTVISIVHPAASSARTRACVYDDKTLFSRPFDLSSERRVHASNTLYIISDYTIVRKRIAPLQCARTRGKRSHRVSLSSTLPVHRNPSPGGPCGGRSETERKTDGQRERERPLDPLAAEGPRRHLPTKNQLSPVPLRPPPGREEPRDRIKYDYDYDDVKMV